MSHAVIHIWNGLRMVVVAALVFCSASSSAETRAVLVGIDAYRHIKPLKGAVADALDIHQALRKRGLPEANITLLTDASATRRNILAAIDDALARLKSGDLFILAFAGHGASERWGKIRPPGVAEAEERTSFVLASVIMPNALGEIDPLLQGSAEERIISTELNSKLSQFEKKKIRVIWIADTCHAGGLTREITLAPGMEAPVLRSLPTAIRFKEGQDPLEAVYRQLPAPVNPDRELTQLTFLAAVDKKNAVAEVPIPAGSSHLRGALSYAFARLIEGSAQVGQSASLTRGDLFAYLKPNIRQLSNQRQIPDLRPLADFSAVVLNLDKDFGTRDAGQQATPLQRPETPEARPQPNGLSLVENRKTVSVFGPSPIDLPVTNSKVSVRRATSAAEADLVLDKGRAIRANGDILAERIGPNDVIGMAEREIAVRNLQALVSKQPKSLRLSDGDRHYKFRERVAFIADESDLQSDRSEEYFLFFNITYNGIVQYLYPYSRTGPVDTARLKARQMIGEVCITKPFGADLTVLVTGSAPLSDLIAKISAMNDEPRAVEAIDLIQTLLRPDMRVGMQGLYTRSDDARETAHPSCR